MDKPWHSSLIAFSELSKVVWLKLSRKILLETPGMEKFSLSNLKLQNYKQLKTKSCNGKCKAILGSDDTNSSVYYNVKNKERQEEGKKKD